MKHALAFLLVLAIAAPILAQEKTYSGQSKLCREVIGRTPTDLQNVQAFCSKGLMPNVVDGAVAMDSLLWIGVTRPIADAMRADRLSAESLIVTWMKAWRSLTGRQSVTVSIRWNNVEFAKGDTTILGGDSVTFK